LHKIFEKILKYGKVLIFLFVCVFIVAVACRLHVSCPFRGYKKLKLNTIVAGRVVNTPPSLCSLSGHASPEEEALPKGLGVLMSLKGVLGG
jgi:hypothetical protein